MGYLFDRERDDHPWAAALDELERADFERAAWACNQRMDARVSEDRERALLGDDAFAPKPDGAPFDGSDLLQRTSHAFQSRLCRSFGTDPPSAYARDANESNRIDAARLHPRQRLVHVASLERILRWCLPMSAVDEADLRDELDVSLGTDARPATLRAKAGELVSTLHGRGPEAVRRFVEILCDRLGDSEPPWWATFAAEIRNELKSEDAGAIARALGLGHFEPETWMIVWTYDVGVVRSAFGSRAFYRPTVLEAGHTPYHFPSPPGRRFGITLPLTENGAACRELLHPPLRGRDAAEACTGRFLKLETAPISARSMLKGLRRRHRERLAAERKGDNDPAEWLRRHPEPAP